MAFLVLSLPRSRSAWLSKWLDRPGEPVGHDELIGCGSVAEFTARFSGPGALAGSCETGAMVGWRLLREAMPEAKLAVVRRPVREVEVSLKRFGFEPDLEELLARDAMLDAVQGLPGVMAVQYWTLRDPLTCAQLYTFCTGAPFDPAHWQLYNSVNIQVQAQERLRHLWLNQHHTASLKAEVARRGLELRGQCDFRFN